jgi:hypothetical protein
MLPADSVRQGIHRAVQEQPMGSPLQRRCHFHCLATLVWLIGWRTPSSVFSVQHRPGRVVLAEDITSGIADKVSDAIEAVRRAYRPGRL